MINCKKCRHLTLWENCSHPCNTYIDHFGRKKYKYLPVTLNGNLNCALFTPHYIKILYKDNPVVHTAAIVIIVLVVGAILGAIAFKVI